MTIHLNFYTSQQYVYDLLCSIIIVSTMYIIVALELFDMYSLVNCCLLNI